MPDAFVVAERARADVALDQRRVVGEVGLVERLGLGRGDLRFEPLHVDLAVAGQADGQRLDRAVGVAELHHDVLQRVGRGPVAVGMAQLGVGVDPVDERGDRRRVRRVVHDRRRQPVERDRRGSGRDDGLDVGGVVARRAADEGVLADVHRGEELLGRRPAHGARHRRHDHVRQTEPVEQRDVGRAMGVVRRLQAGVVEVEAVRVLHHELAATQQTGAGTGLVAVLGLDLVDRQRQVLVRPADVLHEQREHLLVGRGEQEVGALAVLEAEQVVAVLGPAPGRLVGLAGEQGREVHFLEARRRPSPRGRCARRCGTRASRAAATRTRPARPGGCSRPARAGDGWRPRHRPDRLEGSAGTGSTSEAPGHCTERHPAIVCVAERLGRPDGTVTQTGGGPAAGAGVGALSDVARGRCYDDVSIWFGTERRGAEPHALFVERRQFR